MSKISKRMTELLGEMNDRRTNPAGGDKSVVRVVLNQNEFYFADAATAGEAMKLMDSFHSSPQTYKTEEVAYFSSLKAFKESPYAKELKAYWDDREARWAQHSNKKAAK